MTQGGNFRFNVFFVLCTLAQGMVSGVNQILHGIGMLANTCFTSYGISSA